jgi:hypothetical protein
MSDIVASVKIDRAPASVAKIMFDPKNDTKWIDGAKKIEAFEGDATQIGVRVKRHGAFWGSNFTWTTETAAFEPDRLLILRYVEGPMTGQAIYEIAADGAGATVTIRNQGATLAMPGTATMLKQTLKGDLGRLKTLVEKQAKD